MKLGEAITSIGFSLDEKRRIGALLLQKNSVQFNIVHSKIQNAFPDNFWRKAQRKHKITGFRDGHPKAKIAVLERVVLHYKQHPAEDNSELWFFYEACARRYVIDELPALNSALSSEDIDDEDKNLTSSLLKAISEHASTYNFSIDDISSLYNIWWFDRIDNANKLISETFRFSKSIYKISADASNKTNSYTMDFLKELESSINSSSDQEKIFRSKIEDEISNILKLISSSKPHNKINENQELSEHVVKNIAEIESKLTSLSSDFYSIVNIQNKEIEELKTHLVDRLAKMEEEMAKKTTQYNYENNFPELKTNLDRLDFLKNKYSMHWRSSHVLSGLKELFKRTKIIVTDQPDFFLDFLKVFGSSENRSVAVSPLWISGENWQEELDIVTWKSKTPVTLVIIDFDVAIQETYLLPGLAYFLSETASNSCNKILLVPSKPGFSDINTRILEQCPYIESPNALIHMLENDQADSTIDKAESGPGTPYITFEKTYDYELEMQLKLICKNAGVLIPSKTAALFVNLFTGLRCVTNDEIALNISIATTLLPWTTKTLGHGKARVLEETLKMTLS